MAEGGGGGRVETYHITACGDDHRVENHQKEGEAEIEGVSTGALQKLLRKYHTKHTLENQLCLYISGSMD